MELFLTYDQSKELCETIMDWFRNEEVNQMTQSQYIVSLTRITRQWQRGTFSPLNPDYVADTYETMDSPFLYNAYMNASRTEIQKMYLTMKFGAK